MTRKYVKSGKYKKAAILVLPAPPQLTKKQKASVLPYATRVYARSGTEDLPGTVMAHQIIPFPNTHQCDIHYIVQLDAVLEDSLGKSGALVLPSSYVRPT